MGGHGGAGTPNNISRRLPAHQAPGGEPTASAGPDTGPGRGRCRPLEPDIPVRGMAIMRVLSGTVELLAAWLMWRAGRVESALQINAALGVFGPTVLILVTALGIAGLAGRVPPAKLALIGCGALLILLGARR